MRCCDGCTYVHQQEQTQCRMQSLNMQSTSAGAEEGHQSSKELFNETGVPIEPFNLDREREEGHFDAGGGYIPHNFPQVKDAWLESVDSMSLSLCLLSCLNITSNFCCAATSFSL